MSGPMKNLLGALFAAALVIGLVAVCVRAPGCGATIYQEDK